MLQIYHQQWITLDTIIKELFIRGISFNTVVPYPNPKAPQEGYESKGLGLCPVGYNFKSHDTHIGDARRLELFISYHAHSTTFARFSSCL